MVHIPLNQTYLQSILVLLVILIVVVILYIAFFHPTPPSTQIPPPHKHRPKDVPPQASSQLSRAMNVATNEASEGGRYLLTADSDGNMTHASNIQTNATGMRVSGNVQGNQICIGETCLTEDHFNMLKGNQICIGETCLTEDHFKILMGQKPIALENGWSSSQNRKPILAYNASMHEIQASMNLSSTTVKDHTSDNENANQHRWYIHSA